MMLKMMLKILLDKPPRQYKRYGDLHFDGKVSGRYGFCRNVNIMV